MLRVAVQLEPFDEGAELSALRADGVGGIASFTGVVRGGPSEKDGLTELQLDHYPGMTERALTQLAETAVARWCLSGATLIHRVGALHPGDPIVFVGTASPHRAAALEACAFLIDRLKTDAPFWKRETFADGRSAWVEARATDAVAATRWG
jgi:molybdopterin synthase catalytic subunit